MTGEVQPVPAKCAGAPMTQGENPPLLRTPVPVIAVYQDGKPIRVDGCPFYDNGACKAGKNATAENAPVCLFAAKPTQESATPTSIEPTSSSKTLAVPEIPLGVLSIPEPLEDALFAGYLQLQPAAHSLDVDVLATEISNRENLLQTLQLLLGPYKDALVDAVAKPDYKTRRQSKYDDDQYTRLGSSVRAIRNKGGHVRKTIDKRLENGLSEPLHFDYEFNKSGKLDNITVLFHENGSTWGEDRDKNAGAMQIYFAQDEISSIRLVLGNSNRSGDSTQALLQSHGKKDSTFDKFIQSAAPSQLPEGTKLTGKTDLTISFKDLAIDIKNHYSKPNYSGQYYEELQYSAQFNRFLKKEDNKGENGLSVQDFLHLSLDVLQILPFAKS